MGLFVDIISLAKHTLVLVEASVATIRRFKKFAANLFLEFGTDFVAQVASRASTGALGFVLAKIVPVAVRPPYATVADSVSRPFVADDGASADFPRDSRFAFSGLFSYL